MRTFTSPPRRRVRLVSPREAWPGARVLGSPSGRDGLRRWVPRALVYRRRAAAPAAVDAVASASPRADQPALTVNVFRHQHQHVQSALHRHIQQRALHVAQRFLTLAHTLHTTVVSPAPEERSRLPRVTAGLTELARPQLRAGQHAIEHVEDDRPQPAITRRRVERPMARARVAALPVVRAVDPPSPEKSAILALAPATVRTVLRLRPLSATAATPEVEPTPPRPLPVIGRLQRRASPPEPSDPPVEAVERVRRTAVPTVWRANKTQTAPTSVADAAIATIATPPVHRFAQASAGQTPALRALPAPLPPAFSLDGPAIDRLADDVMQRIERRLRIERERRGM
jgi:hypothetical protein